jgi:hypothetical protein
MLPKWVADLPNILKYNLLPHLGFTAFPRDLTQIHRALIGAGFAVAAGEPLRDNSREASDELDRVVQAIVRLASTTT